MNLGVVPHDLLLRSQNIINQKLIDKSEIDLPIFNKKNMLKYAY
jgi:hypothetical protein